MVELQENKAMVVGVRTQKNTKMQTRAYLGYKVAADLKKIGLKYLKFHYKIAASRFFHRYETNGDGKSNTQNALSNLFILEYAC